MHPEPQARAGLAEAVGLRASGARAALAVLACLAVVLALYPHTTRSLYQIWLRSDTFAHGLIVFPMFAYMVWQERRHLGHVPLSPCVPAALLVVLAGFGWLLGRLSSALVVEQASMVVLVPAVAWAVLGTAAMRVLAFPFAFLLLAVPFGEFLVPALIDRTADFTAAALRLSGIPIYRHGNVFEIPSGRWSVVEACSGIRYLMASVLGGMLFAYFFFRSWKRRVAMVLLSAAVAVVGNWLRAYLIVMIGHLSDNRLAGGVDHAIYGWVFFGFIILTLFALALRWAEREPAPARAPPRAAVDGAAPRRGLWWPLIVAGMASMWPVAYAWYDQPAAATVAQVAPVHATMGWSDAGDALPDWQPSYRARAMLHHYFARGGAQVGMFIAYYQDQDEDRELIESRSTLIGPDQDNWALARVEQLSVAAGGERIRVNASRVRSASGSWEVWQCYWVGGYVTTDPYLAKLRLALNILTGRGDDSAAVMVYAPAAETSAGARAVLRGFVDDMWPSIRSALEDTRAAVHRE